MALASAAGRTALGAAMAASAVVKCNAKTADVADPMARLAAQMTQVAYAALVFVVEESAHKMLQSAKARANPAAMILTAAPTHISSSVFSVSATLIAMAGMTGAPTATTTNAAMILFVINRENAVIRVFPEGTNATVIASVAERRSALLAAVARGIALPRNHYGILPAFSKGPSAGFPHT